MRGLQQSSAFRPFMQMFCALLVVTGGASQHDITHIVHSSTANRENMFDMILGKFLLAIVTSTFLSFILLLNFLHGVGTPVPLDTSTAYMLAFQTLSTCLFGIFGSVFSRQLVQVGLMGLTIVLHIWTHLFCVGNSIASPLFRPFVGFVVTLGTCSYVLSMYPVAHFAILTEFLTMASVVCLIVSCFLLLMRFAVLLPILLRMFLVCFTPLFTAKGFTLLTSGSQSIRLTPIGIKVLFCSRIPGMKTAFLATFAEFLGNVVGGKLSHALNCLSSSALLSWCQASKATRFSTWFMRPSLDTSQVYHSC